MTRKFLIAFLWDPSVSYVVVEQLRFGDIVGVVQVTVRCVCCPRNRKLMGKELVLVSSSLQKRHRSW